MSTPFDQARIQNEELYTEDLYCQTLRTPSNHQGELILRLATRLFAQDNSLIAQNPYQHLERLMTESLKMKNLKLSKMIEYKLYEKFNDIPKLMTNHLYLLYMSGATAQAESMLEKLRSRDMRSLPLAHARLAQLKSLMTRAEYMEELKNHLKIEFMDAEAWLELTQLYEANLDFKNAVFCLEEVVLLRSDDIRLYLKLGELYFTLGSAGNWVISKKYFSHVLLQQSDNLRALYGLKNTLKFLIEANEKPSKADLKLQKQVLSRLKALDKF